MIGKVPGCLGAILLFLLPLGVYCQDTVWSMKYNVVSVNHGLRSEINLWNGEVLLAGTLVLKVDSFGTFKWAKWYARQGYIADFLCMTTTYDSCILLAGYIYMPDYGDRNICILKLNRNGEMIWSKAFKIGTGSSAYSISETEDHGFILAGSGAGDVRGPSNLTLIRLDSTGNLVWDRKITCSNNGSTGTGVVQTTDGGFIVTGYIKNTPTDNVLCLLKFSASGEVIWAKRQWATMGYTRGGDVKTTSDGYLCLYFDNNHYCHLMKTDASGNMEWVKQYPFVSDGWEESLKLYRMSSGGYVFVTPSFLYSVSDGALFRINDSGELIWAKEFFSATIGVIQAEDGGILVLGSSIQGVSGSQQYLPPYSLARFDSAGLGDYCTWPLSLTVISTNHGLVNLDVTVDSGCIVLPLNMTTEVTYVNWGIGCSEILPGITEPLTNKRELLISPNPSTGKVNIGLSPLGSGKIECLTIFNSSGVQIFRSSEVETQIDLTNYSCGLYLIRIETTVGTFCERLVLQH